MESCLSCTAIQATALRACAGVKVTLCEQETQGACLSPAEACVSHLIPPRSFQTADAPDIGITVGNVSIGH